MELWKGEGEGETRVWTIYIYYYVQALRPSSTCSMCSTFQTLTPRNLLYVGKTFPSFSMQTLY